MKKIFSFMLMATALLISGNVKAVDWAGMPTTNDNDYDAAVTIDDVTKYCSLKDAFTAVNGKTATIKMLKTPEKIIGATKSGTRMTWGANTDLTWNLTGQTIEFHFYGFALNGAKVNLTGEGTLQFTGQYTSDDLYNENPTTCNEIYRTQNKPYADYNNFHYYFQLFGTTNPESENYSVLTIGKGVTISSSNEYGYGVQIAATEIKPSTTPKTYAAYGVVLDIYGEISAAWGITTNGNISGTGNNVPKIIVEKGAQIVASECSNGIYAGGVAHFEIYGTVAGGTGIYAKAGSFTIDGATVMSTADSFEEPKVEGNGTDGGLGVAIVFDSNSSYAGGMSMTITGESQVIGTAGYAIYEGVTNGTGSLTEKIEVKSGTFVGSEQYGCINMTPGTKQKIIENKSITGGTYSSEEIRDYLDDEGIIIPVVKGDETVYVIAQKPTEAGDWIYDINAANNTKFVKYADGTADITLTNAKTECAYLTITAARKLVIGANQTLSAGEIVLGEDAAIEVAPKGKLIINGVNGIVAFNADNLIIKAAGETVLDEDAEEIVVPVMGSFVLNPAVKANKSPYATVEYYAANARAIGNDNYAWDIFASPFISIESIDNNMSDAIKKEGEPGAYTAFQLWNGNEWENLSKDKIMEKAKAFQAIAVTNMSDKNKGRVTYTMTGRLQGNNTGDFTLDNNYNYMGNGYVADMNGADLVNIAGDDVEQKLWYWNASGQTFLNLPVEDAEDYMVSPLGFFILKAKKATDISLDYNTLIWLPNQPKNE